MSEGKSIEFARQQLADGEHVWRYFQEEDGSARISEFIYTPSEREFDHSGIAPKVRGIAIPKEYTGRVIELLQSQE